MDVVLFELAVHVGVVHPPDALLILDEGRVDDAETIVVQGFGQHRVAGARKAGQGRNNTAQHAVFVPDAVPGQQGGVAAVALHLPPDDGVVIGVRRLKIAIGGVLGPLCQGLGDGGHSGKVHVRYPHGDGVEPRLRGVGGEAGVVAQTVRPRPSTAMESLPCRSRMEVKS